MKVLTISTMYPNRAQPVHAVFVEHRMREVANHVELRVISPIPYFPLATELMGRYRHRTEIPRRDERSGIPVSYPRFLSIPAVLKPLDGVFLFGSILAETLKLRAEGFRPDVIDAHLAFPDGFGAVLLGKVLKLPVTITLRGHDINDLHRFPVRWWQVSYAVRHAQRVFGVCKALVDGAVAVGTDAARTRVLTNGVDAARFYPEDRADARRRLNLPAGARIVLTVGHMVKRKGFQFLVDALAELHARGHGDAHLVIIGAPGEEGDYSRELGARIAERGMQDHVTLAGAVKNDQLRTWYSACDVFALASEKEGWANVLLEALACGRPVVATDVWGTRECVTGPDLGFLVEAQDGTLLANALERALTTQWNEGHLVAYARTHTWRAVGERVAAALRDAAESYRRERGLGRLEDAPRAAAPTTA